MNNTSLNREFTQAMRDRNRNKAKTGFTDSEDEDDSNSKSLKSPKSPKSSLSGRSSLLSSRSPREDLFTTQKRNNMLETIRPGTAKKYSNVDILKSSEEDLSSMGLNRKESRFGGAKEKSLSPKSPRSTDRSEPSFNRTNRFAKHANHDDDSQHTPRSSRSPRSNERDEFDTMSTLRKPLNNEFQLHKARAATPTKLSMTQRIQNSTLSKQTAQKRSQYGGKHDDDIDEEELMTRSGRTTPSRSGSRQKLQESLSPKNSRADSPRSSRSGSPEFKPRQLQRQDSLKNPLARSLSPRDSLNDVRHHKDEDFAKTNEAYDKHTKMIDNLLNPNKPEKIEKSNSLSEKEEKEKFKKQSSQEKDPDVVETVEDSKIAEKLQKEREQKRLQRESRAKNQTESTKKIEDAIEKIENTMEDSIRLKNLKEKNDSLTYSTKPTLNETNVFKIDDTPRGRTVTIKDRRSRTRSLSSSGQFERVLNSKYANVKPKTLTRPLQSARTNDELTNSKLNESNRDFMNDSSSLRQTIYNEWYEKKLLDAKNQLKDARQKQKDEEEKKAQELIDKLQKSVIVFKMWSNTKEESLKEKRKQMREVLKKQEQKEEEKKEKKKTSEIAFREWLKIKTETDKEKKEEKLAEERKKEKEKRKETEKKIVNKKPPVPYEIWAKKKEDEIQQKLNSIADKERQKKQEEREKQKKKELSRKAYEEWLDKKEEDDLNKSRNLNRSLSTSMSSLPPFYPSSRTIPFGR